MLFLLSSIFPTCLLHLGIVAWGEGLSNREFPTSGIYHLAYLEVWDLLITLQSVCAGHLYFVYSYTLMHL